MSNEVLSLNSLRHFMTQDRGLFEAAQQQQQEQAAHDHGIYVDICDSAHMNNVNESWTKKAFISITPQGQLVLNGKESIIESLQACSLQLVPTISPPIISITPYTDSKKRIYLKMVDDYEDDEDAIYAFNEVMGNLLVWSRMRPAGLDKKWGFKESIVEDDKLYGNEILVCRFKIYGPIPTKLKHLAAKNASGSKNAGHHHGLPPPKINGSGGSSVPSSPTTSPHNMGSNHNEGWFMAMGHLKPNGVLDLLAESDGSLLYSINISSLFTSEIRQIDHSIFQNSNILFLGMIPELRSLNLVKATEYPVDQTKKFIIPPPSVAKSDLHHYQNTNRIFLEFPLHIDLEDWFVTLSSFTKREIIGDSGRKSKQLRCLQKIQIDVIEAKFDNNEKYHKKKLYTELTLWGLPWFRTSIVECYKNNPFWRETFQFELPISTNYFQILVKESSSYSREDEEEEYDINDKIVGTIYITPDMLSSNEPIDRLVIYDPFTNQSIGKIFMNLTHQQYHILPAQEYRLFEKMIVSVPFDELIEFFKPLATTADKLEQFSLMFVDIFQTLNKENEWFAALMDHELFPVDSLIRNNRMKGTVSSKTTNVFNTLFRGNSMLTKSLEKYNFRVGQEYLEKTIGEFVSKVSEEQLNCEVDPRLIEAKNDHKQDILAKHRANLLNYVEELWALINKTSNDLPEAIKTQLTKFRLKVENSVEPSDTVTPLNCLTAFLFLRFFCPAILNPKLFYLTKNHQTGDVQRTLTLVAKVLLNLANRTKFVEHKEPYLLPFNEFITQHEAEVYEYFDKLTGRKLDFQPKILELSDEVPRPSLNIPSEVLQELPTNPYLIDKYLRIVEFITLICAQDPPVAAAASPSVAATATPTAALAAKTESFHAESANRTNGIEKGLANTTTTTTTSSSEEQLFKIHTIEDDDDDDDDLHNENLFADLNLYDKNPKDSKSENQNGNSNGHDDTARATNANHENNNDDSDIARQTDTFLKNLLKSSSDDFDDFMRTNLRLQDLQSQSRLILEKTMKTINHLAKPETISRHFTTISGGGIGSSTTNLSSVLSSSNNNGTPMALNSISVTSAWASFVDRILEDAIINLNTKQILFVNHHNGNGNDTVELNKTKFKYLSSGGFKFKIMNKNMPLKIVDTGLMRSGSMSTVRLSDVSKRNPLKRLFGKNKK